MTCGKVGRVGQSRQRDECNNRYLKGLRERDSGFRGGMGGVEVWEVCM